MPRPLRELAARAGLLLSNRIKVAKLQRRTSLQVHLGCGDDRLPGFVNVDRRKTPAADVVMDLDLPRFTRGSIAIAFSNAFFEHLYRESRLPHLRRIFESLAADGLCCYIGIPYFRNVARFYLERAPGTSGPLFDLYNVYRYTHGDPEQAPAWWLDQLHKSLFDEEELALLLQESGFASFVMFCYGYPGDATELPVNMGFYATKGPRPPDRLRADCLMFLGQFADRKIRIGTLEWRRL
jgi:predicted SAM-dependent methyltransferase